MSSKSGIAIVGAVVALAAVGGGAYWYTGQQVTQEVRASLEEMRTSLPASVTLTYGDVTTSVIEGKAAVSNVVLAGPDASITVKTLDMGQPDSENRVSFVAKDLTMVEVGGAQADKPVTMTLGTLVVENLDPAPIARLVQQDQTAVTDFSAEAVSMTLLSVADEDNSTASIGALRFGKIAKGVFADVAVENFDLKGSDGEVVKVRTMTLGGLNIAEAMKMNEPEEALRRVMMDSLSVEGMFVRGVDGEEVSMKRMAIDEVTRWKGMNTGGRMVIEELSVPLELGDAEAVMMAQQFGIESLVMDLETRASLDPVTKDVQGTSNLLLRDLARLTLDFDVAKLDVDLEAFAVMPAEQQGEASIQALLGSELRTIKVKLDDLGLVKTSVAKQAAEMGMTKPDLIAQAKQMMMMELSQALPPELAQTVADQVTAFMNDKNSLTVAVTPKQAMPMMAMAMTAAGDPASVLDIVVVAE